MSKLPETLVELRGVSKRYGPITAVHPINLEIRRGEFLAILGPSCCGKTTLPKSVILHIARGDDGLVWARAKNSEVVDGEI